MNPLFKKLETPAYDFFKTNPDLKNCIYLTLSGSHGYGTNNDNSDIDLRGVLIEPSSTLFGLQTFEQFEERETDTVIYGLKKFVALCANGNPNTLELLGTHEDCIYQIAPEGQLLRDHSHLFLSQRVIQSYGNYATAQFRRLSNALCHDHYSETEQELHLCNSLNSQIEHFNQSYHSFEKNQIEIFLPKNEEEPQLLFNIHLANYPVRDFTNIYSEIANTIKTYNKLNHRNRKKDDLHLYKHAMHLIRLLKMGTDILHGKGIHTRRTHDLPLLIDIRNGKLSFSEIFDLADQVKNDFDQAAKATALPEKPNLEKIEELMKIIYHSVLPN